MNESGFKPGENEADFGTYGSVEEREGEPVVKAVVELNFMRHGTKEKGADERVIRLTPLGKLQALCAALKIENNEESIARASERQRAHETAGIAVLASEIVSQLGSNLAELESVRDKLMKKEELNSTEQDLVDRAADLMSLEKLNNEFAQKFDSEGIEWIEEDPRLDFNTDGKSGELENQAYGEGRLMDYVVNESDQDAVRFGDKVSTTYSKMAGAVARLLMGYADAGEQLKELVDGTPDAYAKIKKGDDYVFSRMFGTHASVGESFMLKTLGLLEANGEIPAGTRDQIVEKMGQMFKEAEGIKVRIENSSKGQSIVMGLPERIATDSVKEVAVGREILRKIIGEEEELVEAIEKGAGELA